MKLPINQIIQEDTLKTLKQRPSNSVDTIITSPPYWGLRDYGEDTKTIWDGDKDCKHEWEAEVTKQDNLRFRPGHSTTVGNFLKADIYSSNKIKVVSVLNVVLGTVN